MMPKKLCPFLLLECKNPHYIAFVFMYFAQCRRRKESAALVMVFPEVRSKTHNELGLIAQGQPYSPVQATNQYIFFGMLSIPTLVLIEITPLSCIYNGELSLFPTCPIFNDLSVHFKFLIFLDTRRTRLCVCCVWMKQCVT